MIPNRRSSSFRRVLGEIDVSCSPCRSRSRAAGGAVVIGTGRRSRLNSRIDVPSFLPGSARITTGVRKCFPGGTAREPPEDCPSRPPVGKAKSSRVPASSMERGGGRPRPSADNSEHQEMSPTGERPFEVSLPEK